MSSITWTHPHTRTHTVHVSNVQNGVKWDSQGQAPSTVKDQKHNLQTFKYKIPLDILTRLYSATKVLFNIPLGVLLWICKLETKLSHKYKKHLKISI